MIKHEVGMNWDLSESTSSRKFSWLKKQEQKPFKLVYLGIDMSSDKEIK